MVGLNRWYVLSESSPIRKIKDSASPVTSSDYSERYPNCENINSGTFA